jgi:TonB family protein
MIKGLYISLTTIGLVGVLSSKTCAGQDTLKNSRPNIPRHLPSLPLVPQFPGGKDSLEAFLKKNVHYPALAKKHNITGTVEVDFSVDEQGKLTNIHVYKPLGYGCDKEALRVVKKMPKWNPGRDGRKPMALDYHVDIIFAPSEKK